MKTRTTLWKTIALIAFLALLLAMPKIARNDYQVRILNMTGLYILLSLGLNIAQGFCGQINLAIGAFWAIGAYTAALLNVNFKWPFWLTLPAAMVVAALVAAVVALPSLKVRSHYLAIVTLGLGEVINIILVNEDQITRGAMGIPNIKRPSFFGIPINTEQKYFYLVLAFVILGYLVARQITRHRFGRAFRAVRDDYVAAKAMGVNTGFYQILAITISGVYAGVAGVLFAHLNTYISPDIFEFRSTLFVLTMTLLGGMGSLLGSVVGGVLVILQEVLRAFRDWQLVFYGLAVVLVVLFFPGGAVGIARRWRERQGARRAREEEANTAANPPSEEAR
ncbi:MAG: branched-chain amino acid ABC transporter permease [Chloroflexi bacterium]|nr:branched-chain amino acid ABC transporter permease [Chloroflexota bacterium]